MKKFISLLLAMVMALALMVPAAATSYDSFTEIGSQDKDTTEWNFDGDYLFVKQSTYGMIWFRSVDVMNTMSGGTFTTADAAPLDVATYFKTHAPKFVNNDAGNGLGSGAVLAFGEGSFDFAKLFNSEDSQLANTVITIKNGVLTIAGAISHANAACNVTPVDPTPTPINATLKIKKTINGKAPAYEGFTFTITGTDADGAVNQTITTNKTTGIGESSVTVKVIPGESYTFTAAETANAKYADQAPQTWTIAVPEDATALEHTFTFDNVPADGTTSSVFEIQKFVNNLETPGEGFVFEIIAPDGKTVVATMTTDENGAATTDDIYVEAGTYTIREKYDADKYEPSANNIEVTVDAKGDVKPVDPNFDNTITNYERVPVSFDVTKTVKGGTDLAGFQFAIYNGNTQIATATSAADGKASFENVKLTVGTTYTIKEIAQDKTNYEANTELFTVSVDADHNVNVVNAGNETVNEAVFTNYKLVPIDVKVTKDVVGDGAVRGFQFELYNAKGEKLGSVTTNAAGEATFGTKVRVGTYTIKEALTTAQKADYEANTQTYTVVVGDDGAVTVTNADNEEVTEAAFTNYKLTELDITKYINDDETPATTGTFNFVVKDSANQTVPADVTKKSGGVYHFKFKENLDAGKYTIVEQLTDLQKADYVDGKTLTFTVDDEGVADVDGEGKFINEERTKFEINKWLNEVGNSIKTDTFDFEVWALNGEGTEDDVQYDADVTKDGDTYKFNCETRLADGEYTIVEVLGDDQDGKYVDGKTLTFTVENGEAVFADGDNNFVNDNRGKLDIKVPTQVYQQYIKQVHETAYRVYSEGTLVSHVASVSGADLPSGITGSYLKNGMTYLTINKAKLAAAGEDGVNIGIATSDPQNKRSTWNTPAPAPRGEEDQPSYNLKIEDGKLVVTSELPNIGARLYGAKESVKGPSDFKGGSYATKGHLTGKTEVSFDIPKGDSFKFFLHIENTKYETNEKIGCKLVSSETLTKEIADCTITTTVTDSTGEIVDASQLLPTGMYTITVKATKTVEGETVVVDTWTKTVEVKPGETATVTFDKLMMEEKGEPVIICPENCGQVKMVPLTPAAPVEP